MVNLDGRFDGAISRLGNVGCYLHGLFGSDAYRRALLKQLGFEPDETHPTPQAWNRRWMS